MHRYEIRAATRSDLEGLIELAAFLDSVNLPNDPVAVEQIVVASDASFSGEMGDPRRREHVFVLYDREAGRPIGTSMIIGQLGRRDAPYIYFDVSREERYSATLDKHFVHEMLSMGYSYNGPTEIGGLVMHPDSRRVADKLGMQISYVRFLWIAAHRRDIQDQVLAELLPPLEPDGTSHLWEAVGRRFTGLTYREADRLSKRNKEFIRGLFPDGDIYATLLSPEARAVVGKVGPQTRGVEKLLRRIGFRYAHRVDPFDGGPHFVAATDEITLVQRTVTAPVRVGTVGVSGRALISTEYDGPPWFRAVAAGFAHQEGGPVTIDAATAEHLEVADGDEVSMLPLD